MTAMLVSYFRTLAALWAHDVDAAYWLGLAGRIESGAVPVPSYFRKDSHAILLRSA
jgi:hypothetical protein